jgi:O-methyltransferase involved in polyketide biosynthesis
LDRALIKWYNLDFPDVIEIRKRVMPETDRIKCIAKSIMDTSWMEDIKGIKDRILLFSGGVLEYLEARRHGGLPNKIPSIRSMSIMTSQDR